MGGNILKTMKRREGGREYPTDNEKKRDKVGGNILQKIKRMKDNWIGHILCRNCLQERVFEGKTEGRIGVSARRGRRHKQLLNNLKEKRGYSKLKEEALDRTVWRTRFARVCGPVVRRTA